MNRGLLNRKKISRSVKTLLLLLLLVFLTPTLMKSTWAENTEKGNCSIVIVYDTSGSMNDRVESKNGKSRKFEVANRALEQVVNKIEDYQKKGNKVQAGLICFPGFFNNGDAVKFGAWDKEKFTSWLRGFKSPSGGTPLGNAIKRAGDIVMN